MKRAVFVLLIVALLVPMMAVSVSAAPDASHICKGWAEALPDDFEEFFGNHGGCVSILQTAGSPVGVCKFSAAISEDFYPDVFKNQGQCVKSFK